MIELIEAARSGNLAVVHRLLDEGADPNEAEYEGMTPLMVAAMADHVDIAKALLDHGAEIDECDDCAQTALCHAICQGSHNATKLLLERGADPEVENWLALNFAVRFGTAPLVKQLLDLGADPNAQDEDDPTPLMEAVERGHREMVELLLNAGADPEQTAEAGTKAFDVALQHRHAEIVELLEPVTTPSPKSLQAAVQARDTRLVEQLIARGVSVNACDEEFGYTPLSWAAENGSAQIARWLIEAGAEIEARDWMNQTPLWSAVMHDRTEVVRILLEAGAEFELRDDSDDTLLQSAIWAEAEESVRLLLEAGADPNLVADGAPAALHWTVAQNAVELTELLLKSGADPNLALPGGRDTGMFEGLNPGSTPLMIAARNGELPLVNLLLEAGADWRLSDDQAQTAVDVATQAGHTQVLKRLESAGAEVDYGSQELHDAALLEAVEHQHVEGVRHALASGARIHLKHDPSDRSPLMRACLEGNCEIVQLLLDAGAAPNARTQWDESALSDAVVRGHSGAVRLLLAAGAAVDGAYPPHSVPAGKPNTIIPSRFCPLADAVSQGHAEIAEMLIQAGADPNQVSPHGDSPLLAAVTSRQFELASRLLVAGAQPRDEDADYLDILQWEHRSTDTAYQQSIRDIQRLAGVTPELVDGLPGARSFRFTVPDKSSPAGSGTSDTTQAMLEWAKDFGDDYNSLAAQVTTVIDEQRQQIARRGYHLLDAGMPLGCGPMTRFVALIPTADPFAVMAAFGTHGNDDELSNRDLIQWFRDFGREHAFVLVGCKYDTVVIELERPLDDPKQWARRLLDFDSDIWPDDLSRFERHLETATRIHFWWD